MEKLQSDKDTLYVIKINTILMKECLPDPVQIVLCN
jgi:hypothetical protein